jgi:aspartate aminotransferase-like enzyme
MSISPPTVDAVQYAAIEDRLAALLRTRRDTLVIGGEAILALEALARGVGGADTRALNVVTGPYGAMMGHWLGASGGEVATIEAAAGRAIGADQLRVALARQPADVVCVVHAEAATGVVNPLAELAAVAHEAGAVLLVDAVASVGAEPLEIDLLKLDAVVIGPQKAMGGPAGVCGLSAGDRIWELIDGNPAAPRDSILSLADLRRRWLVAGRATLPFVPHHLEILALDEALGRLESEGLDAVVERHRRARNAARAGLTALGLELWVSEDREAAAVATLVRPPHGVGGAELLARVRLPAPVEAAPGALANEALRVMHNGPAGSLEAVLVAVAALGDAVARSGAHAELGPALAAAESAWSEPSRPGAV